MLVSFSALWAELADRGVRWLRTSRRVWQADCCPVGYTACGDVAGCVHVGVLSEAARRAPKSGLVGPVGLGGVPSGGAALRRVRRVHVHDRHPSPGRLIGDVLAELAERPDRKSTRL